MGIDDTFSAIFGNIRYQYFCLQAMSLRLLRNDARGTTSPVAACTLAVMPWCTVQGDVNYIRWTQVLGSVCSANGRTGVKIRLSRQTQKHLLWNPTTSYIQSSWHYTLLKLLCGR